MGWVEERTQRRAVLDVGAKQVAGADGLELGEAVEEALRLGALTDAGGSDEEDAGGAVEMHRQTGCEEES